MSYIVNGTRVVSLTINGQDYTQNLSEWNVSDASANRSGCVSTSGSLALSTIPGQSSLEDYDRNTFRRGNEVILELSQNGVNFRHPRGLLYVISCSYSVESETLEVEIGCKLSMMSLLEEFDDLKEIIPVPVDVIQETYEGCCAAFASVGKYVYQDNNGNLVSQKYFQGDGIGSVASPNWISVLGVTSQSVSPLSASGPIPDQIKLSYQVPTGSLSEDNTGRVDVTETESYYFLTYPAATYQRQNSDATVDNPNGTLDNVDSVSSEQATTGSSSSCGNLPDRPDGNTDNGTACNGGYTLVQSPLYLPAITKQVETSTYGAPGAQLSSQISTLEGPRVESNPQYFADNFAYCRQVWGSKCQPNGNCPQDGMDNIVLRRTETTNFFGEANEIVKQIQDNYVTKLSAAQPSDWRAGNVGGQIQQFDKSYLTNSELYRQSRVETNYSVEDNVNIQETITYTSMTSRGVGISGGQNIDALAGIKTRVVRKSSTIASRDIQPDTLNSPNTDTEEKTTVLRINVIGGGGTLYGDYVEEEQIPVPLLYETESEIEEAVNSYSDYIRRFTIGDAYGLQIGEALRLDVVSSWTPSAPFRYYDPKQNKLVSLRMDATSWGVSPEESAFVTSGIWTAFTNGTLVIPENVTGNSTPDMSAKSDGVNPGNGTSTPVPTPPSPVVPPSVSGEVIVNADPLIFDVDVYFTFSAIAETVTEDGIQPGLPAFGRVSTYFTTTVWCSGLIVEPGDLLSPNTDGSVPFDYYGSLVVVDATVVVGDLFSA